MTENEQYKDKEWLSEQVKQGKTITDITKECGAKDENNVRYYFKKYHLTPEPKPSDIEVVGDYKDDLLLLKKLALFCQIKLGTGVGVGTRVSATINAKIDKILENDIGYKKIIEHQQLIEAKDKQITALTMKVNELEDTLTKMLNTFRDIESKQLPKNPLSDMLDV